MSPHNKGWFGRFLFGKGGKSGGEESLQILERQEGDKERQGDGAMNGVDRGRKAGWRTGIG